MIASTEDRLTNYANWLTANKDRKGQPEFQKVAEAYKALRSAPVRQDKTVFASPDPGAPAFGQPVPDKPMSAGEYATGLGANVAQGLLAGWGDELAGVSAGMVGALPKIAGIEGAPTYESGRDTFRAVRNDFAERRPVAATVANIAGAIPTIFAAPAVKAVSYGGRIGQAAMIGGGYGAIAGAGEGDGGAVNRALGAGVGAVAGATFGAALEAVAPAVMSLVSKFSKNAARAPRLMDETGGLTPEGRAILTRVGMNPDEIPPGFLQQLQARVAAGTGKATDPDALAREALANSLDVPVPLLTGQKTLNPNHQGFEYDARAGVYDGLARNEIAGVDARAESALRDNMDALMRRISGGAEPIPYRGAGGELVSARLSAAERAAKSKVNAAYDEARANGIAAGLPREASNELVTTLRGAVTGYAPESAPATYSIIGEFGRNVERMTGDGATRIGRIFDLRQRLRNAGAGGTPDQSAGAAAVRSIDNYLNEALERDLISGDRNAIQLWNRAIASRREYGDAFQGNDIIERLTARDRISGTVQLVEPPEKAANVILGTSDLAFVNKPELVRSMATLRDRLGPDSAEWNGLRQEVLLRLFQRTSGATKPEGSALSGANFVSAIDSFAAKNKPLWELVFTQEERAKIRTLAQVMKLVTVPVEGAKNFSGTAPALVRAVKSIAGTPLFGNVLNWAARSFDNMAKLVQAQRAASGVIPSATEVGASRAAVGAAIPAVQTANQLSPFNRGR